MTLGLSDISSALNISPTILILLLVWTVVWKGLALWKSARLNQPVWFIIILIVNLFGILDILYIFLFSKIKLDSPTKKANRKKIKQNKRKK